MSKQGEKQEGTQRLKLPGIELEGKQDFILKVLGASALVVLGVAIGIVLCYFWLSRLPSWIDPLIGNAVNATVAAQPTMTPMPPTPRVTLTPPRADEYAVEVEVSASKFPFADTNVAIEKGDIVQVIVLGNDANWNCGKGATSAEGRFNDKWVGHIVPSANQCELVGFIRDGVFLRIGAYERFEAAESGSLHLGANDDPDQSADNSGTLVVRIIVTR